MDGVGAGMENWANGTVEQLRHDIDRGRTGDKINWPDPAAAPLGSDDEAGGAPPTREQILYALRTECGRVADRPPLDPRGLGAAWVLIGLIVAFAAVLLVYGQIEVMAFR